MNALQQLIADYLRDHPGESYATIGRRGGISRQTVQSNATTERRRQTPHPATLEALAKGMGMSLETVKAAAREAAGYHALLPDEVNTPGGLLMWEAYGRLDDARRHELEARARYLLDEHEREQRSRGESSSGGESGE